MPTSRSIGGISASFSVIDEFSGPLKAALDQIAALQKTLDGAVGRSKAWAGAAAKVVASLDAAVPSMVALGDAAERSIPAIRTGMADVAVSATVLKDRVGGASAAVANLTKMSTGASAPFATMATAAGRLETAMANVNTRMSVLVHKSAAVVASSREAAAVAGSTAGGAESMGSPFKKLSHGPELVERGGIFFGYEAMKTALKTNHTSEHAIDLYDTGAKGRSHRSAMDVAFLTHLSWAIARRMIATAQVAASTYGDIAHVLRTAPRVDGPKKWKDFAGKGPIFGRASEGLNTNGLGSLDQSAKAIVAYAHRIDGYAPAGGVRRLARILSIGEIREAKSKSLEATMSYGLPIARGAGMSMSQGALATGFLMWGGLGQRAGDAVGQMVTGLSQTGGALMATLTATEKARDPIDARGNLTVLSKQGNADLNKAMADINRAAQRMSKIQLAGGRHAAFGIRSMHGAAPMVAPRNLLPYVEKSANTTPAGAGRQVGFTMTGMQQFEQVWRRLQDIGNIMATSIVLDALASTNAMLRLTQALDSLFRNNAWQARLVVGAGAAAGIGSMIPVVGTAAGAVAAGAAAVLGSRNPSVPEIPSASKLSDHDAMVMAGVLGDITVPNAVRPPPPIHVNAPLNVTVEGSMLGDCASLGMFLSDWWQRHAADVGNTVAAQISAQQKQQKRRTFLDSVYS